MRRTFLVWVIFLLTVISVIFQLGSIISVFSGAVTLPPEAFAQMDAVGSEEIAVDLLVGVYFLVAGFALFMMRRSAVPLFLIGIPIKLLQYAWTIYLHGWAMYADMLSLFATLVCFGLGLLVCFYVWSLDRRGALA